MEQTPLEKIVKEIFSSKKVPFCDRIYNTLSLKDVPVFTGKTQIAAQSSTPVPWSCATDELLKLWLNHWSFFVTGTNDSIRTEYVVELLFYALAEHEGQCAEPRACEHTLKFVREFCEKPDKQQEEIIDELISGGLYSERLQFMDVNLRQAILISKGTSTDTGPSSVYILQLTPELHVTTEGKFFGVGPGRYESEKCAPEKFCCAELRDLFSRIDTVCAVGLTRDNIIENKEFAQLLGEVIEEKYGGKPKT